MTESGVETGDPSPPSRGTRGRAEEGAGPPADLGALERELGRVDGSRSGPVVLITAGLHGNEPAGVRAAREVLGELAGAGCAGRVLALAGNLRALRDGKRHGGRDLNRLWKDEVLAEILAGDPSADEPDEAELRDVHGIIERERAAARAAGQRLVLLDLHSTSAGGGPFIVVPDAVRSRRLARAVGLPVVLGLEQRIDGPLLTWLVTGGDSGIVIEGGQHTDPRTADVLADALRVALRALGVAPEGWAPAGAARARIEGVRGDVPPVLDMVHAHPIEPGDGFVMEPGWSNFRRVTAGQTLALQRGEVVQAPLEGYMLMPLYQGLGTEGFFLCEPVGRPWLAASRVARALGLQRLLPLLPGLRSGRPGADEVVQRADAPGWTRAWLTLLGYRTSSPVEGGLRWTRSRSRSRS